MRIRPTINSADLDRRTWSDLNTLRILKPKRLVCRSSRTFNLPRDVDHPATRNHDPRRSARAGHRRIRTQPLAQDPDLHQTSQANESPPRSSTARPCRWPHAPRNAACEHTDWPYRNPARTLPVREGTRRRILERFAGRPSTTPGGPGTSTQYQETTHAE